MSTRVTTEGTSGLDDYLNTAHGNAAKIRKRGGVWIRLIRAVDAAFVVGEETLDPMPGTVTGAFIISSHASWLAAANLSLCMHAADSFQPMRASIESAFYGYHVHNDKEAFNRWKTRPTTAEIEAAASSAAAQELRRQRRAIGSEFSVTTIAKSFPAELAGLQRRSIRLYEELIDYGGHFNFPVLSRAFRPTGKESADVYSAEVRILLAQEPEQVFAFRKLTEAGVIALEVLDAAVAAVGIRCESAAR